MIVCRGGAQQSASWRSGAQPLSVGRFLQSGYFPFPSRKYEGKCEIELTELSKPPFLAAEAEFSARRGMMMYERLLQLAGDAQAMADEVRGLIADCHDYEMLRLLKKLDAELMDVRHNLQLGLQLPRRDEHTV